MNKLFSLVLATTILAATPLLAMDQPEDISSTLITYPKLNNLSEFFDKDVVKPDLPNFLKCVGAKKGIDFFLASSEDIRIWGYRCSRPSEVNFLKLSDVHIKNVRLNNGTYLRCPVFSYAEISDNYNDGEMYLVGLPCNLVENSLITIKNLKLVVDDIEVAPGMGAKPLSAEKSNYFDFNLQTDAFNTHYRLSFSPSDFSSED